MTPINTTRSSSGSRCAPLCHQASCCTYGPQPGVPCGIPPVGNGAFGSMRTSCGPGCGRAVPGRAPEVEHPNLGAGCVPPEDRLSPVPCDPDVWRLPRPCVTMRGLRSRSPVETGRRSVVRAGPVRTRREAGASPARSRHCDRGANPTPHHWDPCVARRVHRAEAAAILGRPGERRSGSQETCRGALIRRPRVRSGRGPDAPVPLREEVGSPRLVLGCVRRRVRVHVDVVRLRRVRRPAPPRRSPRRSTPLTGR